MIRTDLNFLAPSPAVRYGLLCGALILGACVDGADLGDVPGETEAMGGTEGTQGSTDGSLTSVATQGGETEGDTEGVETTPGGCERVAAQPGDPHAWALICGSGAREGVDILEVMPSGDLIVGVSSGTVAQFPSPIWQLGGEEYTHTGISNELLIRFDSNGELMWSRHFASETHMSLRSATPCGEDILIAGYGSDGSVDLGDDTIIQAEFIARYGADGALQWSRAFDVMEPSGGMFVSDMHCDAAGNVAISGTVRDGVDLGAGMLPAGVSDSFVAKFDASGEPLFGKTLLADATANGGEVARAIAVAAHDDGGTYVFLDHTAPVDFGSGPIDPPNEFVGNQSLLARLSETGDLVWSTPIGGDGLVYAGDLMIDAQGRAIVAGAFLSFIDLGEMTFGNVFPYEEQDPKLDGTNYDSYIAAFEPDGTYAWGEALGWLSNEGALLGRFNGNQALVYRVSDRQLSLATHSADGSGGLLDAQFEAPDSARQFGLMRANDSAVALGGAMGDSLGWPLDASEYASGNGDAVVVYFDL